jgi:hypothetical protein
MSSSRNEGKASRIGEACTFSNRFGCIGFVDISLVVLLGFWMRFLIGTDTLFFRHCHSKDRLDRSGFSCGRHDHPATDTYLLRVAAIATLPFPSPPCSLSPPKSPVDAPQAQPLPQPLATSFNFVLDLPKPSRRA